MKTAQLKIVILVCIMALACKKPFNPESIQGFSSALIVEGIINTNGVTNITLSRTLDLDDKVMVRPELKATVQILAENNAATNLAELGSGRYSINQLNLNSAQKYRLKIRTFAGQEYLSDPLSVRTTPAIDSVNWVRDPNGVAIYVNTHDAQNKTRYYQWEFQEDWEIRSTNHSEFKLVPNTQPRGPAWQLASRTAQETQDMYTCYRHERSTNILITSTAKLSTDLVSRYPLVNIPSSSDKLSYRYSMLVRQYAIDFQTFEYLSMMKRNSEQLGSFFDAQPSELMGNMRNVADPQDVVIGYIGIAPVVEKRIFITRDQVPGWGFRMTCRDLNVPRDSLEYYFGPGSGNLIGGVGESAPSGAVSTYTGSSDACLDCHLRGGDNVKPSFW